MLSDQQELHFREAAFAWIRTQQLHKPFFTRDDLSVFEFEGSRHRLIGPYTGIWKVSSLSDSAIAISTAYVPDGGKRPYEDGEGADGLQRYKWRGTDPNQSDNRALRRAMERKLPLLWLIGIGVVPGTSQQLFDAPTLQHSIKAMDGQILQQIPIEVSSKPDRDLLAERFEKFQKAS